ncbi:undecaprenyl-diphosphate phosphatase [Methyloceanibacter caenitepidi]|uniref:Undecaprenyl-diphosphatase n=1 Tax=Methyloceanibacter caenitepidi TaxID=1384459 RepID=A0A0A8JZL0_9HYPH|nr:undecaprenyl-diphosphate phosphatase [Methyloceanibacter caenitepidi]BAQ15995.1 undecaprenyl-diphosphatase [Methyloceanibacter caenitepidi]
MTIEQIIVIAVVQGITEFLPISSSGHLVLVPYLFHWPDQGQFVDVMVHVGTLFAILIYFWRDVWKLIVGALELFRGKVTQDGKLAIYIVLATIPAVAFGLFLKKFGVGDLERSVTIVAWNTVIYGILMLIADMLGRQEKTIENMTLKSAMIIGVAQALALIPGTSRSGITMTAARFLNFTRPDAARFSFLLGIPAIAGAGVLTVGEALASGDAITMDAIYCAILTFFAGLAAIAFLMALVRRISFLPFVLYRMVLGGFLLFMIYL